MLKGICRISRESWIIATICLVDLVLTCIWIRGHSAREGNPIMNFYLQHGMPMFVASKLALIAGPLLILEWARHKRPQFVTRVARFTIAAYLGAYGIMFLRVNVPTLMRGTPSGGYDHGLEDATWTEEAPGIPTPPERELMPRPDASGNQARAALLARLP